MGQGAGFLKNGLNPARFEAGRLNHAPRQAATAAEPNATCAAQAKPPPENAMLLFTHRLLIDWCRALRRAAFPSCAPEADGQLSPSACHVLFEEGTEAPGSSPLNGEKRAGTYLCAACHTPLFASSRKYDSGTGWPSFWQALPGAVATRPDHRLAQARIEYHCAHCGGHQGHVFEDGPAPSGQRYCNNGLALYFVPEGEPLPPRRA